MVFFEGSPMTIPYTNEPVKLTKAACPTPGPEAQQAHFLAILPRIEAHAQIRFGFLKCPGKRDDAIAEVVAVAWKWFLRLIEQRKDVNDFVMVLADYAVRHVRNGRRLCGQEKAKDVLSPRAQRLKGFAVERLPSSILRSHNALYSDPHSQDLIDAFEERLRDNTITPPPDAAAFRIDYPRWLSQLGQRNREIAEDMAKDYGTFELAQRHNISPGRVSQLRREFHLNWQRFHGSEA
jgi:hypothetical protein